MISKPFNKKIIPYQLNISHSMFISILIILKSYFNPISRPIIIIHILYPTIIFIWEMRLTFKNYLAIRVQLKRYHFKMKYLKDKEKTSIKSYTSI